MAVHGDVIKPWFYGRPTTLSVRFDKAHTQDNLPGTELHGMAFPS